MRPQELVKLAKAECFSRAMLYRARDALGSSTENTVARHHPNNAWKWAGTG